MSRLISKQTLFNTNTYSVVLKKYNFLFQNKTDDTEHSYILDIDIFESNFLIRHYILLTQTESYIKLINKKTKIKSDQSCHCNGYYIFDNIQHYIHMLEITKNKDKVLQDLKEKIDFFIQRFNKININQYKTKKLFYEDEIEFFKEPTYKNETLYYSYHPDDEFDDSDISLSNKEYKRKRHSTYVYFTIKDNILSYDLVYKIINHTIPEASIPGDKRITNSFLITPENLKFIKNANQDQLKKYFKKIYWKKINKKLRNPFRNPQKTYLPYYKKWKKGSEEEAIEIIKSLLITIAFKKERNIDLKLNLESDVKNKNNPYDMELFLIINFKKQNSLEQKKDNFIKLMKKIIFEEFYFVGWKRTTNCYYDKRLLAAYEKEALRLEIKIENVNSHEYIDAQIKTRNFLEKKYPNQDVTKIIQNLQNLFQKKLD